MSRFRSAILDAARRAWLAPHKYALFLLAIIPLGPSPSLVASESAASSTRVTVTVLTSGGTVVSSPQGIACPPTCSASFANSTLTLTPIPRGNWAFDSWAGACADQPDICVLRLTGSDIDVDASFRPPEILHLSVSGSGRVAISPLGVDPITGRAASRYCQVRRRNLLGRCDVGYFRATQVVVSSTPTSGFQALPWSRYDCRLGKPCRVTVDSGDSYLWTGFSGRRLLLDVQSTVQNGGTVSSSPAGIACPPRCSADFAGNETLHLTANPAGAPFKGWTPPCYTNPPVPTCTVALRTDLLVAAGFGRPPFVFVPLGNEKMRLRIDRGGSAAGTISQAGSLSGSSTCPPNCNAQFKRPEDVTLLANGGGTAGFKRWRTPFCVTGNRRCSINTTDVTSVGVCFDARDAPHSIRSVNVKRVGRKARRVMTVRFSSRHNLASLRIVAARKGTRTPLKLISVRLAAGVAQTRVPRAMRAGRYLILLRMTDRIGCSWDVAPYRFQLRG